MSAESTHDVGVRCSIGTSFANINQDRVLIDVCDNRSDEFIASIVANIMSAFSTHDVGVMTPSGVRLLKGTKSSPAEETPFLLLLR